MPRGVYDRSKNKKAGTEKTTKAAAKSPAAKTTGKRGWKAAGATKTAAPVEVSDEVGTQIFSDVVDHLTKLVSIRASYAGSVNPHVEIVGKFDSEISFILDGIKSARTPEVAAESSETESDETETETRKVSPPSALPAPVPFTPPAQQGSNAQA